MSIPVFLKGEWIDIDVPSSFTGAMAFAYASTWAIVRGKVNEKEINDKEVSSLTEAIIYQRMFPGLIYHKTLQEKINKVLTFL
jgi:hypothetical protein